LNDLIDIVRRLVLAVDFFIFSVGELGRNEAGMTREQAELIGRRRAGYRLDLGAYDRLGE
jgi:hypothetical protein